MEESFVCLSVCLYVFLYDCLCGVVEGVSRCGGVMVAWPTPDSLDHKSHPQQYQWLYLNAMIEPEQYHWFYVPASAWRVKHMLGHIGSVE